MTSSPHTLSDVDLCQELGSCFSEGITGNGIPHPNREWTTKTKESFAVLAKRFGLHAQYTRSQESGFGREYLCDILLWRKDSLEAELVVECEWNSRQEELRKDFRKLLLVKAPLKIFICQVGDINSSLKNIFEPALRDFTVHLPGERYLVLHLPAILKNGCSFEAYSWTAPNSFAARVSPELTKVSGGPFTF